MSQAQFRAMQAAAHGRSSIGIPKKVGQEFASETESPKDLPARALKRSPKAEVMRQRRGSGP